MWESENSSRRRAFSASSDALRASNSALRDAALTVLRQLGLDSIRAGLEHCSKHREELIDTARHGMIQRPCPSLAPT